MINYKKIIDKSPTSCNVNYIKSIEMLLDMTKDITGDIIELGVAKGTNSLIFGELLKQKNSNKKYIGIDTFTGYTDKDLEESKDNVSEKNYISLKKMQDDKRWLYDPNKVRNLLNGLNCKIIEGDINVVVPKLTKNNIKVSLLYVDCNVYSAAYNAMVELSPNMDSGSVIAIDEHTIGGETKAIKKFSKENNLEIVKTGYSYPNGFPMYIKIK